MDDDIFDDDYGGAYGYSVCVVQLKGKTKTLDGTRALEFNIRARPEFIFYGDDCESGCSGYLFLEPVKKIKDKMVMPTLMTLERLGIDSDMINKDFNKLDETQDDYIEYEIDDVSKINMYVGEDNILDAIIEDKKTKKVFDKLREKASKEQQQF